MKKNALYIVRDGNGRWIRRYVNPLNPTPGTGGIPLHSYLFEGRRYCVRKGEYKFKNTNGVYRITRDTFKSMGYHVAFAVYDQYDDEPHDFFQACYVTEMNNDPEYQQAVKRQEAKHKHKLRKQQMEEVKRKHKIRKQQMEEVKANRTLTVPATATNELPHTSYIKETTNTEPFNYEIDTPYGKVKCRLAEHVSQLVRQLST